MLKRLLKAKLAPPPPAPSVPDGLLVYAVGDVHGRRDLLDQLLAAVSEDRKRRSQPRAMVIFLGDLVDRGPDSKGVIDRLIALSGDERFEARFLMGNHDEVFLKSITGDAKALRMLTRIGGEQTVLSYGITGEEYRAADFEELSRLLSERVPAGHARFLETFDDYLEIGDYLFVHAGIRPGVEIAEQSIADLRWIRGEFLSCRTSHGKVVVHGHSISEEPERMPNRIGIDTGAFASGRLTALGLAGDDQWFVVAEGTPDPAWGGRMTD